MAKAEDFDALAGAQGKLVVFIASLLQRSAVLKTAEFASLLDVYADSVAETAPQEAAFLTAWSSEVRAVGGH